MQQLPSLSLADPLALQQSVNVVTQNQNMPQPLLEPHVIHHQNSNHVPFVTVEQTPPQIFGSLDPADNSRSLIIVQPVQVGNLFTNWKLT